MDIHGSSSGGRHGRSFQKQHASPHLMWTLNVFYIPQFRVDRNSARVAKTCQNVGSVSEPSTLEADDRDELMAVISDVHVLGHPVYSDTLNTPHSLSLHKFRTWKCNFSLFRN